MKSIKQKRHQKKSQRILIISLAVVLVVALVLVYLIPFKGSLLGWQPFRTTETQPTSQQGLDSDTTQTDKGGDSPQTTDQIPINPDLTATIVDLKQANGFVLFSGTTNATKSNGQCSILFTNPNDRPISRTLEAKNVNGVMTCGPIQIAETEFSYLGEWTVTFRYYTSDNNSQAVAEKKLTIE